MTPHMKLDEKAVEAALDAWYEGRRPAHRETTKLGLCSAISAYLSAAHAPQGGVRGEPVCYVTEEAIKLMRGARPGWAYHTTCNNPDERDKDGRPVVPLFALTGSDPQ